MQMLHSSLAVTVLSLSGLVRRTSVKQHATVCDRLSSKHKQSDPLSLWHGRSQIYGRRVVEVAQRGAWSSPPMTSEAGRNRQNISSHGLFGPAGECCRPTGVFAVGSRLLAPVVHASVLARDQCGRCGVGYAAGGPL